MATNTVRISRPRYKRKSQQKSIKEDFLNFINSDGVTGFIGEEVQKDVYFIVNGYTDAFIDKIKISPFKDKGADFWTAEDIITKAPKYDNCTPLSSGFYLFNYNRGGLIAYLYEKLLEIILDVLSMVEQKENYAQNEISKDIQKALNVVKSKAEKLLNTKLDHKKAEMILMAYEYCRADQDETGEEWYFEYGEKIEEYFNIDFGFRISTDEYGENAEVDLFPDRRLMFDEITGIEIDDITLDLIAPFLDFIARVGCNHKIFFKNKITNEEKQPINEFLYQLNDVFGLGIKKEINDGLFISLIIDGYFALQEKD